MDDACKHVLPKRVGDGAAHQGRPSVWAAFGIVVLYVALQTLLRWPIQRVIGATWRGLTGSAVAADDMGAVTLVPSATIGALTAVVTISVSAALVVMIVRLVWPALWWRGAIPGFGLVPPKHKSSYLSATMFAVATLFLGGMLTGLITLMLPGSPSVHQNMMALFSRSPPISRVLIALVAIGVAPFVEELLLRGVLLSSLAARVRVRWAIAATAVLFAVLHLPGVGFAWYVLPQFILFGLVLGWLRVQAGSLWPAVAMHATANGLVLLPFFASLVRSGVN